MKFTGRIVFSAKQLQGKLPEDTVKELAALEQMHSIEVEGTTVYGMEIFHGPYDPYGHELWVLIRDLEDKLPSWLEGVPYIVEIDKITLEDSLGLDLAIRSQALHSATGRAADIKISATDLAKAKEAFHFVQDLSSSNT